MFADKVNFNEVEREDDLGHKVNFNEVEREGGLGQVYSYENELLYTGHQQGFSEGEISKAIENAQNFLEMGLSSEQVVKGTGLPLEKVMHLKEQMK